MSLNLFPTFANDPFFDGFFSYQPRRLTQRAIGDTGSRSVVPADNANNWLSRWYNFDDFKELEDVLKLKEEPDKYLVQVKDATASKKDLKVNYHKNENQLEVTILHNYEKNDGDSRTFSSSSTSTSTVSFEKPVKFDKISAEVGNEGVIITVPKEEVDEANVVSIDVTRNEEAEGKKDAE